MRSRKPYTNATFTRRVDHEAGRHRPPRAASEPAVCGTCGAVYRQRRWYPAGSETGVEAEPPTVVTCPACARVAQHLPSGFLYLDGAFVAAHRDEIEHLLRAEADRAAEDNPTARIMEWTRDPHHAAVVTTTTEHLAQRLGHALAKAFHGDIRYDFSHENKLARVYWSRD
ncbi:MAG: BCAM0308 family protein [Vicinamibacterales bacterium]